MMLNKYAIFKNRLEIRSPGGLYGGLTIEKIKKEEVSSKSLCST